MMMMMMNVALITSARSSKYSADTHNTAPDEALYQSVSSWLQCVDDSCSFI